MKYKSLLTDEIEVNIGYINNCGYYWKIVAAERFGIDNLYQPDLSEKLAVAKKNFIATAKRNGWTKWKFIE